MTGGPEELTVAEANRRDTLCEVVEGYRRKELAAAGALREIRERRLYRPGTWTAFCDRRLPVTRRHANRLIVLATVTEDMRPRGPAPTCEKQARWLAPLSDQQRNWVAKRVDGDTRGHGFEGATAERVRDLAREVTGEGALIPIGERALVLTDRHGPVPLKRSGFLPLLDAMAEAALSTRLLGNHALEDAVLALRELPPEDQVARRDQIEIVAEVAASLVGVELKTWPEGAPEGQERFPTLSVEPLLRRGAWLSDGDRGFISGSR